MSWKKTSHRRPPPPDPPNPLQDSAFRVRLARLIGRGIDHRADTEDLVQETLLHTMVTAARHDTTDARQVAKIAQGIARNLVAQQHRQRIRKPDTSGLLDDRREVETNHDDALIAATQEHLRALRAQLEPHLGRAQRALLAAYLDDGIVRIGALAAHLGTTRQHVHRMLSGIGKKVLKLTRRRRE